MNWESILFSSLFFFIVLLSLFFLFCAALKLFDDKLCSFLTFDSFSCFFSLVVEQIEAAGSKKEWGKKSKGKLTFSLNEGGTGHRDASVTMQGKLLFFSLARSLCPPH